MCAANHAITFFARHRAAIFGNLHLRSTIVKGDQDGVWCQHTIKPPRNRLPRPIWALIILLTERRMWIRLGENVAIAVLVERMFERIPVSWKFHNRSEIRCWSSLLSCWPCCKLIARQFTLLLSTSLG